jgi:hypothetical protein
MTRSTTLLMILVAVLSAVFAALTIADAATLTF